MHGGPWLGVGLVAWEEGGEGGGGGEAGGAVAGGAAELALGRWIEGSAVGTKGGGGGGEDGAVGTGEGGGKGEGGGEMARWERWVLEVRRRLLAVKTSGHSGERP